MNNYFFGLNKTSHLYQNSKVIEKSPLFQNNYDHVRFIRSVGQTSFNFANYANKDAATNNKNISDSQTLSLSGSESAETKLRKIQEIAGPDAKIDTETLNKIYSGQDVNVTLNKLEGEHRNLFIGLGSLVAQLIGGAAGAAFNPELSGAISDRFRGDVEFLKRNGNDYGLNLFGRASTGGVEIAAAIIPQEEAPKKVFNDTLLLQQLEEAKRTQTRETQEIAARSLVEAGLIDTVDNAFKYVGLSVENHNRDIGSTGTGANATTLGSTSLLDPKTGKLNDPNGLLSQNRPLNIDQNFYLASASEYGKAVTQRGAYIAPAGGETPEQRAAREKIVSSVHVNETALTTGYVLASTGKVEDPKLVQARQRAVSDFVSVNAALLVGKSVEITVKDSKGNDVKKTITGEDLQKRLAEANDPNLSQEARGRALLSLYNDTAGALEKQTGNKLDHFIGEIGRASCRERV